MAYADQVFFTESCNIRVHCRYLSRLPAEKKNNNNNNNNKNSRVPPWEWWIFRFPPAFNHPASRLQIFFHPAYPQRKKAYLASRGQTYVRPSSCTSWPNSHGKKQFPCFVSLPIRLLTFILIYLMTVHRTLFDNPFEILPVKVFQEMFANTSV